MEKITTLGERISARFEHHQRDLAGKQQQLDVRMKELLEQREQMSAAAEAKINEIVLPAMQELARHFDNAKIEVLRPDSGSSCICKLSHTDRFPATVQIGIAVSLATTERLTARYELSILPVLMEYSSHAEQIFPAEDEGSLSQWVEDRILDFLDTYLRLETHPTYQRDNLVVDIVCGMQISTTSAATVLEQDGQTLYFCSDHCKQAYLKNHH